MYTDDTFLTAEQRPPTGQSIACQSMSAFRRYLDRRVSVLAQDREVVRYYALPHVPDPSAHPDFEEIFRDAWVVSQGHVSGKRQRLCAYCFCLFFWYARSGIDDRGRLEVWESR